MRILLTGCNGFIGRHLNYVVSMRRVIRDKTCSQNSRSDDEFYIRSLNGKTDWSGAFDGIDAIIHLAGLAHSDKYTLDDFQQVNVEGTLNLARQASKAGVNRFVFVSSIGVNGTATRQVPFSTNSTLHPHNAYAQSKYKAELGLKKIAQDTGLEVVVVRPVLVYGPNAPGNFGALTRLVRKISILPFGLANNRRDFIAVQNLADLLVTCASHPNAAGKTFLASDGKSVSIKDFTTAIAGGLGKNVFQLPVPVSLMRLAGHLVGKSAMIEQLLGNLEVDSADIKEVLGWVPPYSMEQAMYSLIENNK